MDKAGRAALWAWIQAPRVVISGATLKSTKDMEAWLQEVRSLVERKLQDGPVIL